MCLCALHCEMRNTEQLLKSIGLLAHEIGSLPECNDELSKYGPSNFKGNRITIKLRQGQQTAAGRNNVSFASCSGQFNLRNWYLRPCDRCVIKPYLFLVMFKAYLTICKYCVVFFEWQIETIKLRLQKTFLQGHFEKGEFFRLPQALLSWVEKLSQK